MHLIDDGIQGSESLIADIKSLHIGFGYSNQKKFLKFKKYEIILIKAPSKLLKPYTSRSGKIRVGF